ncbi:MAG: hypothetical protein DCC75_02435, partial [Proteobacteria bacterium]
MTNQVSKSTESHSNQVIVQCPNCQTKFGLDSSIVNGLEDPRFHCSRCDHVFSWELRNEYSPPADAAASQPLLEPEEDLGEQFDDLETIDREEAEPPTLVADPQQPEFDEEEPKWKPVPAVLKSDENDPPSWREKFSRDLFSEEAPQRKDSHGLSFPKRVARGAAPEPPHERLSAAPAQNLSARATSQMQLNFERGDQIEMPFNQGGGAGSSRQEQVTEMRANRDWLFDTDNMEGIERSSQERKPYDKEELNLSESLQEAKTSSAPMQSETPYTARSVLPGSSANGSAAARNSWRSFTLLSAPLVSFLVLLGAFAYVLQEPSPLSSSLIHGLFPNLPQVAPQGLYIASTRMKEVVLDSGERIRVVSGRLVNDSSHQFKDVIIEAMGYNHLN